MKFLHLTLLLIIANTLLLNKVLAQTHQGAIHYERKIDVYRHLPDEQMKAMVPQFQTAAYDLFFNDSISVYKVTPKDEAPDPFESNTGGARVIMRFGGPGVDGALYKNYSTGRLLEETSLEDKKYIIDDSIRSLPWKLSDETSTLLGHACKKATATTLRGSQVTAWYSTDIPVPIGPDKFSGLPGAILKLDADSSSVTYTATQILPATNPKELKAPTGGKAIARTDFEKLMDQVMGPADAQGRRMKTRTN